MCKLVSDYQYFNYNTIYRITHISYSQCDYLLITCRIDDLPVSSCERLLETGTSSSTSNSVSKDPRIVLHPFAKA